MAKARAVNIPHPQDLFGLMFSAAALSHNRQLSWEVSPYFGAETGFISVLEMLLPACKKKGRKCGSLIIHVAGESWLHQPEKKNHSSFPVQIVMILRGSRGTLFTYFLPSLRLLWNWSQHALHELLSTFYTSRGQIKCITLYYIFCRPRRGDTEWLLP